MRRDLDTRSYRGGRHRCRCASRAPAHLPLVSKDPHAVHPPHPLRQPPRRLRRPLSRRRRGLRHPRSRRQRHRCRLRGGHRARRAASRRGERGRRGADHDPHRAGQGRHHRGPRPLAQALPGRSLHARAWRQDAVGHPAHRRAGRARRVDHRPYRLRHHVVRRRRRRRRALCPRRLRGVRVHGDHDQAVRGRLSLLAVQCGDLPARRQAAPGRRPLRADRSRRHAAVHDRPGARGVQARPPGRARRGARRLLLRRHRRDDRALPRDPRRLSRARRSRQLPQPLRGAGAGALARLRGLHLRAVVPGPDAGPGAAHDRGGGRP